MFGVPILLLMAIGTVLFPGLMYRITQVLFWSGFIAASAYLSYIYIINPEGTQTWILQDMKWYWILATPIISGFGFICVIFFTLGFTED